MASHFTIARPYAKAVFELAQEEKALGQWSEMLALAATIAEDKNMQKLMKDPNFSSEEIVKLFLEVGGDKFSPLMQNFINVLSANKRLELLDEISKGYESLREVAEREVKVSLISALPVSEKDRQQIELALKNRTHCNVVLTTQVDKHILGGAIIRAGDLIIDGSIRGRLNKLNDMINIF